MNNIGRNSFDIGYMDVLASANSPLHSLSPRAKIITTLFFIVTVVSFDKYEVLGLLPFFIYPAVLIASAGLPAGYLLRKVLLVSPFAILLGIFNPLIDKQILFYFGTLGVSGGWFSFSSIMLRFVLTVTSAMCLVALTGFNTICESLLSLGVPRVFVSQLLFFYRYIFVLADEAERMVRASSFRGSFRAVLGFKVFVPLVGNLLLRTLDRAERIYCAMSCRMFDGHMHAHKQGRITYREIRYIVGWAGLFLFFRFFNFPLYLGYLVTGHLK